MTYSIWLEPTTNDAKYPSKLIRQLGKKYNAPVFAPHITLYGGVRTYKQAIIAAKTCSDLSKMKVSATGANYSNYLWKTLFIEIKKDKNLQETIFRLKAVLGNSYKFSPHISLVYKKLDTHTKKQIVKELRIKHAYYLTK